MEVSRSTLMPCLGREVGHSDPLKADALKRLDAKTHYSGAHIEKTPAFIVPAAKVASILPSERQDTHAPAHAARKWLLKPDLREAAENP
jgi:hypothetical protein